jgi:hypothetical protein
MPHPKVKIADNSGNEVAVTSNALDVNIASGTADIDIGDVEILGHGEVFAFTQNVTDSAVVLTTRACKHADIMAAIANTGIVYIGKSGVSATTGIALYPGDVYSVDITTTALLYCISTVSGDDINVVTYN